MRAGFIFGVFVLGLALGVALGWQWRRPRHEPEAIRNPATTVTAPAVPTTAKPESLRPRPPWEEASPKLEAELAAISDAPAWLRRWVSAGADREQLELARALVARWAATDAQAALDFVTNAPVFPGRIAAAVAPLVELAKRDITAVTRWTTANLTQEECANITADLVLQLGETQPASALELAFAPNFPVDRPVFGTLLAALARRDPTAALGYFNRLSEEGRRVAAPSFISAWYGTDRAAALQWVRSQQGLPGGEIAAQGLLLAVAEAAPADLAATASQLNLQSFEFNRDYSPLHGLSSEALLALVPLMPADKRHEAIRRIVDQELPRNPDIALKIARESLSAEQAERALAVAWHEWVSSDRPAALAWAQTSSDPSIKNLATQVQQRSLIEQDPVAYLTSITSRPDAGVDSSSVERALDLIADLEPAKAAQLVAQLPTQLTSPAADRTYSMIAQSWLLRDESAALDWVNTLPASPQRDAALAQFASHWTRSNDLAKATVALDNIGDRDAQLAARWRIFQMAYERNATGAQQWLQTQQLSPEVRSAWLVMVQSRW